MSSQSDAPTGPPDGDIDLDSIFRSLRRGSTLTFGVQVAGAGLGYLLEVVLARVLGPEAYGEYTWVMATVYLLAVVGALGMPKASVRFIAEYRTNRHWQLLKGLFIRGLQLIGLTGIALVAIVTVAILFLVESPTEAWLLLLLFGAALVPLRSFLDFEMGVSRGLKKMVLAFAPTSIFRPLLLMGAIGFAVAIGTEVSSGEALGLTALVYLVLVVGHGFVIWRKLPDESRLSEARFAEKKWLRVSLPLLLAAASFMLLSRTDVIMLGILSDSRNVGLYNSASRTAQLTGYVAIALNSIAGPLISELFTRGERQKLQELAGRVSAWTFWPSLAIGLGLIVLARPVLGLFGSEFAAARIPLVVLVAGYVLASSVGSVAYLLDMTGYQDYTAKVVAMSSVLNIVLNVVAIPLLGAVGAAIATITSMMVWNLWLRRTVKRELAIEPSILWYM